MRCEQWVWTADAGWQGHAQALPQAGLVLYFGDRETVADPARHQELRARWPNAALLGCSTGGQIHGVEIEDANVVAVAVQFRATTVRLACVPIADPADSHACGRAIGATLQSADLAGVFVLSDGLAVNGSQLVAGIGAAVGPQIRISGGLAGDGADFGRTLVGAGAIPPAERLVAAIGFYGDAIQLGHGSAGGWADFGPHRRLTRAAGNVLMELDGEPALDLYERYLGEEAAGLPGSALLFPLRIWDPRHPDHDVVRTVLGIDRATRSMTFAGDVPQGWVGQLMHANLEQLTTGAAAAAEQAAAQAADTPQLALMVSCIGRRLLMGQAAQEEIEAASAQLPPGTRLAGFYSYGEIAPHARSGVCSLHNQTMTVTLIGERPAA